MEAKSILLREFLKGNLKKMHQEGGVDGRMELLTADSSIS